MLRADFKKQRCPNCCTEIDQKDYFDHSLQCLRKKYHCTICDIVIDSDKKEEHNETFKSPKFIINAIQKDDTSSFIKSLNHGLDPNIEINENKDRVIHLISRKNNLPMMKALFENDSKVDINVINKNNETPLITAIENKSEETEQNTNLEDIQNNDENIGGAEEILKMAKNFPEVMRFIK